MNKILIVGCGLCGGVIARQCAEAGFKVSIIERRNHIAGNLFDFRDEHGILLQKYGPHTFHTNKKSIFDYISKFSDWEEYNLTCGAVINNICTPTPFNFKTIDDYSAIEFFLTKDTCKHIQVEAISKQILIYHEFSSATQLCPTLCDPMNCSTPGLPVHYQFPEFTQTHIHQGSDASSHLILCHPLSSCPQSLQALGSFPMS